MLAKSFSRRGFLASAPLLAQRRTASPNVVVILADDLGYGDVGCYNPESRIATPAMDRLAREGVRFTDAHSPSSVCTPTRYGLMTGRYCWRSKLKQGVLNGYSPCLLEPGRATIASRLKAAGYATGGFGKWHLGLGVAEKTDYASELTPGPLDHGFDEYFGIPASLDMPPYVFFDGRRAVEQPTATIETNGAPPRGAFWRGGPIAPSFRMEDVLPKTIERACAFVEMSAATRKPFFTYVALNGPHTPWVPSKPFQGRSKRAGLYGDFVEEVDAAVGRMAATLEKTGAARNTLFVVTSDNGTPWMPEDRDRADGHESNRPWRGQKSDVYDGGHRVPFLVRWPAKTRAGAISNQLTCLTDIYASAMEAAGQPAGQGGEDSFSFMPALQGGKSARRSIVHHSGSGMFAIRDQDWKLVLGLGSGGFTRPQQIKPEAGQIDRQLFDLRNDPGEKTDLAAARPEKVKEYEALLARIQDRGSSSSSDDRR